MRYDIGCKQRGYKQLHVGYHEFMAGICRDEMHFQIGNNQTMEVLLILPGKTRRSNQPTIGIPATRMVVRTAVKTLYQLSMAINGLVWGYS